jgi:hypothetical protein
MIPTMIASLRHFLGWLVSAFCSRENLVLENMALHQQLLALHAQRPRLVRVGFAFDFYVSFDGGALGQDRTHLGLGRTRQQVGL